MIPCSEVFPSRGHGCVTGGFGWGCGAGCAGGVAERGSPAGRWQRGRHRDRHGVGHGAVLSGWRWHGSHGRAGHQHPGELDRGDGGLWALYQTQGGLWCPQVPFCAPSVVVGTGVGVPWAPLSLPNWIPIPALCFHWFKSHLKAEGRKVFSNHVFPAAGRATPRAGMSYCGGDKRFCYFFSLYKQ